MAEDTKKKPFGALDGISFAVLFLAICFFLYMAFGRTAMQNRKNFRSLTKKTDTELQVLTKKKLEWDASRAPEGSESAASGLSNVPMLLQKINKESIACGLELSTIQKVDDNTYKLSCFAPFYRLVNFLQRIEESNLAVQDMDILPFSDQKNRIHIVLKLTEDQMTENNLEILDASRKRADRPFRNPFQKEPGSQESSSPPDVIDLTSKFKLTGVGFDRAQYANINHKNYYVGDELSGMRIVKIENGRVDLVSNSQKYTIRFRYKKPLKKK
ncbi:MAG: hypothetical protein JRJ82_23455 [Deltaproteobacteria bacterium]|nr:hypothetical protein [Deltaproteobacteria bacterium]